MLITNPVKASESIAILQEQRVVEMEAQKATLEAIEKENARNNPPHLLSVIKRKIFRGRCSNGNAIRCRPFLFDSSSPLWG